MTDRIIINPITRISGFMEIDVVLKNNIVVEAKTSGQLFRGFEKMLSGRSPLDAVYFTQRICGICSAAHSTASALALESAFNINPPEQGRYLRDIVHGCEFLQNHIRHFYQYTLPDFIKMPSKFPIYNTEHNDFRLPESVNNRVVDHYFRSLEISRSAHEMLAVLGGKAPHNHGIYIGGITTQPTADKIVKIKSILTKIRDFIISVMVPDVEILAKYYNEYFRIGVGYGNLLSYGCFNDYKSLGTLYLAASIYSDGVVKKMDTTKISESLKYSWYKGDTQVPYEESADQNFNKNKAYSWIKAARYDGKPYEVGPLARMCLSGEYKNGVSMMDRTIARVLEAKKITEIMAVLLNNVIPDVNTQEEYEIPETSSGQGLIDTTRGALGHWIGIGKKIIDHYQIITPTVWNLSTKDDTYNGTVEQALLGTVVEDIKHPVELGRIIRSFDPCVSCATHVYIPEREVKTFTILP